MSVLSACLYVYHMFALCERRSEEGITFPGNGVTGGCEMNCWCWELNLDPLQEQLVLLTTKQSLQPPGSFFKLRNGPWGENYCLPWNTGGCTVLCFSIGVASGWSQHQTYSVANEHALPWRWSWSEGLWSSWGWALKFYSLDPLLILSLFPDYRGIHTHTTHIHRPHLTHTLFWNVGIWTPRLLRARQVLCHWVLSQSFLTLFEIEIGPHKLPSLASNFLILLTLTPELVTEVTSVCPSARL